MLHEENWLVLDDLGGVFRARNTEGAVNVAVCGLVKVLLDRVAVILHNPHQWLEPVCCFGR